MDTLPYITHTRYWVEWIQTYSVGNKPVPFKGSSAMTFRDKSVAERYAEVIRLSEDTKDVEIKEKSVVGFPVAIDAQTPMHFM